MNPLQQILAAAGQKTHEQYYDATFTWRGVAYPCSHSQITRNPLLIIGGLSPATEVSITIRTALLPTTYPSPKKGDQCDLRLDSDAAPLRLHIQTAITSVGGTLLTMLCTDQSQGA